LNDPTIAGLQVWVYPEELEHVSPDRLVEQVLALGFDAVAMAVLYHRARRYFPRHRRVSVLRSSTLYLQPDSARYGTVVPMGASTPGLFRFREACERAGVAFRAWIVPLHNDGLVAAHPDLAARFVDGSRTEHALCPSQPAVVEYVAALAADVAAQLGPDTVDVEGVFYPAWEPAYTLTLALDPPTEEDRLLLTQCLCDACRSHLPADAQERARAGGDDGLLTQLAAGRAAGAARLVDAIATAVHREGARLRISCSGSPRQAMLQGVSPVAVAAADGVIYGCGPCVGDDLLRRFEGLRAMIARTGMVSVNWARGRDLAGDAAALREAGADGLALYNLSLVPDDGLADLAAAAAAFRSEDVR
jgi:hypothetical protein